MCPQSRNRLVFCVQTVSVQTSDANPMACRLENVWPGTSPSPIPWLSRTFRPHYQPLAPPLRMQQTGRSSNTSRWLTHTHTFIPSAFETLGHINSMGSAFLIQLVDASQLTLATCKKRLSYFNACHSVYSVIMLFASTEAFVPVVLISTPNHS